MKKTLKQKQYSVPILFMIFYIIMLSGCSNVSAEKENAKSEERISESEEEINSSLKDNLKSYESTSEVDITLDGLERKNRIGSTYPENNEFLIVTITVKNNKKDSLVAKMKSFKLVDDDGVQYDYTLSGQMAWYSEINGILDPITITLYTSGITQVFDIVFDIPSNIKGLKLITTEDLPYNELKLDL